MEAMVVSIGWRRLVAWQRVGRQPYERVNAAVGGGVPRGGSVQVVSGA